MKYKVLIQATKKWKTRKLLHNEIKRVMMSSGVFTEVIIDTITYDKGKPKIKDGKIDHNWYEKNISYTAKAMGYNHTMFNFSMREGRDWKIENIVRGVNIKDQDNFGESWVRSDEYSLIRLKDGKKVKRYIKTVLHEVGHELKNKGLTNLLIHDFDKNERFSDIEDFYLQLRQNKMNQIQTLKEKISQLIRQYLFVGFGLLPVVKRKVDLVLEEMELLGYPMRIVEGYRSIERQNKLYSQGRSTNGLIVTNAKGGESLHNYGVAVDLVFKKEGYNATIRQWETFGVIAEKHGFEWGGRWKNFIDKPHIEMKLGYSLKDFQNQTVDYLKFN